MSPFATITPAGIALTLAELFGTMNAADGAAPEPDTDDTDDDAPDCCGLANDCRAEAPAPAACAPAIGPREPIGLSTRDLRAHVDDALELVQVEKRTIVLHAAGTAPAPGGCLQIGDGRPVAVILPVDEYRRLTGMGIELRKLAAHAGAVSRYAQALAASA